MATKSKKLTIKYWNSLDIGTRKRAIKCVFPLMRGLDYMAEEKPDPKDAWWELIFKKVRIPSDPEYWKLIINGTYIQ